MQRKIVMCCFLIHNFIRVNQGYEDEYDVVEDEEEDSLILALWMLKIVVTMQHLL